MVEFLILSPPSNCCWNSAVVVKGPHFHLFLPSNLELYMDSPLYQHNLSAYSALLVLKFLVPTKYIWRKCLQKKSFPALQKGSLIKGQMLRKCKEYNIMQKAHTFILVQMDIHMSLSLITSSYFHFYCLGVMSTWGLLSVKPS